MGSSKTALHSAEDYLQELSLEIGDSNSAEEKRTTESLFWAAYEDEDDNVSVEALRARNLIDELRGEFESANWDTGRIRVLLRALRLTRDPEALLFVDKYFEHLLPFMKDIVALIVEMRDLVDQNRAQWSKRTLDLLVSKPVSRLASARAWLFELLIQQVVDVPRGRMGELAALSGVLDRRQFFRLMGKLSKQSYFRARKTSIDQISQW